MAAVVVPGDDVSDDDNVSVLLAEEPRRSAQHRDLTGWGIDETEVQPRMAEEDPEHEPFAAARANDAVAATSMCTAAAAEPATTPHQTRVFRHAPFTI